MFRAAGKHNAGINFSTTKIKPARQLEEAAASHHSSQEERRPDSAAKEIPPSPPLPKNNGLRSKLAQLFDTKKVPHPPAERFEGNWEQNVAEEICKRWVETKKEHNASTVSLVALSKIKALEYERKNRESIPDDQLIFPGLSKKHDYYEAEIKAFLEAVGEADPDSVLESFKRTGMGGLHRQHIVASATISGAVGAAASLVPDPTAKAALSGVRLVLQAITAERILDAGQRRLRNAGTEDMLPLGRADAAPSAKQAPNVFQASHAAIWELMGVEKNLRRMESALGDLNKAHNAHEGNPSVENKQALDNARKKLEMAYAKACYQTSVKAAYKAASESAKIEFRGNKFHLLSSFTGSGLNVGTSLFSIATPTLSTLVGASAATAITGGAAAGAVAAALLLYVGYQLSPGPRKDGEAKAKRAIVALCKSLDVLNADNIASQKKRADAYRVYIEERKAVRFSLPATKSKVKKEAAEKLLKRLEEITQEENGKQEPMALKENWEAYRAHENAVSEIKLSAEEVKAALAEFKTAQDAENDLSEGKFEELEGQIEAQTKAQIEALEDAFQKKHKADFDVKTLVDGWKTPMRMRMDSAGRLLKGKVAQSHERLIKLIESHRRLTEDDPLSVKKKIEKESEIAKLKQELAKNLLDMFNLELSLKYMQPVIDGKDTDADAMKHAAAAMGAIQDEHVRSLFIGDARAQVEAVNLSKKMTFGEAERYTYINAGSNAIGMGLNLSLPAVDFGLNMGKATHSVHVGLYDPNPEGKIRIPKFNDYKFAALPQASAPPAAHLAAGDRAAFQKREMQKLFKVTENKGDAVEAKYELENSSCSYFRKDDKKVEAGIEALVDQLENLDSVPEKMTISMKKPKAPAPDEHAVSLPVSEKYEHISVSADMKTAAAYHRVRRKNAPLDKRIKSTATQIGIGARQALMSAAGLPTQAIAQIPLKRTRAPLKQTVELGSKIRQALAKTPPLDKHPETTEAEQNFLDKLQQDQAHGVTGIELREAMGKRGISQKSSSSFLNTMRSAFADKMRPERKDLRKMDDAVLKEQIEIGMELRSGKTQYWREAVKEQKKRDVMKDRLNEAVTERPIEKKTRKELRNELKEKRKANHSTVETLQQMMPRLKRNSNTSKVMSLLSQEELETMREAKHPEIRNAAEAEAKKRLKMMERLGISNSEAATDAQTSIQSSPESLPPESA